MGSPHSILDLLRFIAYRTICRRRSRRRIHPNPTGSLGHGSEVLENLVPAANRTPAGYHVMFCLPASQCTPKQIDCAQAQKTGDTEAILSCDAEGRLRRTTLKPNLDECHD